MTGSTTRPPRDEDLPAGILQKLLPDRTEINGKMIDLKTGELIDDPGLSEAEMIESECKDVANKIENLQSRGKSWEDGLAAALAEKQIEVKPKG